MDRNHETHHHERGQAAQVNQVASGRYKPRRESKTNETPKHKQPRSQSAHFGPAAVPMIAGGLVFVHERRRREWSVLMKTLP